MDFATESDAACFRRVVGDDDRADTAIVAPDEDLQSMWAEVGSILEGVRQNEPAHVGILANEDFRVGPAHADRAGLVEEARPISRSVHNDHTV